MIECIELCEICNAIINDLYKWIPLCIHFQTCVVLYKCKVVLEKNFFLLISYINFEGPTVLFSLLWMKISICIY